MDTFKLEKLPLIKDIEAKNTDKTLVKKVIRALLLLEGLVKQEIQFVFKGGTALMLHLLVESTFKKY